MYYYHYLPRADISAIACGTRRVNEADYLYPHVENMVRQELKKRTQVEQCFETSSRRAVFRRLLEDKLTDPADRCAAVEKALQAAQYIMSEDRKEDVSVTAENYGEMLDLLTDLLARYNPSEAEINRFARKLDKETAAKDMEVFSQDHIKKLTAQAVALTYLAKDGKLTAFREDTTLTDAVDFVMADDAVARIHTLCKAGEAGEIVGAVLGFALVSAAVIAVSCGAALAVMAPIVLAESAVLGEVMSIGVLLGLLYLFFADWDKTEAALENVMDRVINVSANVVGDVVTSVVSHAVVDSDPDLLFA